MTILHNARVTLADTSQLKVMAFDTGHVILSGEWLTHSWSSYIPIAKCREYGEALIAAADAWDAHVAEAAEKELS